MRNRWIWTLSALMLTLGACGEPEPAAEQVVVRHPAPAAAEEAPADEASPELSPGERLMPDPIVGTVRETMNSGGYTYMRLEEGAMNIWVAAMHLDVEVGDRVVVRGGSMMQGFRSRTLDRTFDAIVFASRAQISGEEEAAPPGHGAMPPGHPPMADG